ncbi:hypothetical protein MmTuc01_0202 [Methanosarcina mazei Tuc01]|uniref:Uncharacterized protein n=1 Tax=Methanosarcina mazei Tuc01 TaxID=1236903 RepID=M1Q049_METMZ|nr:hypothetical protein MmTuc01_0202 [Methanosarcina mazei Tuc01]
MLDSALESWNDGVPSCKIQNTKALQKCTMNFSSLAGRETGKEI